MIGNRLLIIVLNILEAYVWLKIANLFLKSKYRRTINQIAMCSIAVTMILKTMIFWYNNNAVFNYFLTPVILLSILIATIILYEDSLKVKLLIVLLYVVGLGLSDIMVMIIFLITQKTAIVEFTIPTTTITIVSIVSRYILLELVRKFYAWQNNIVCVENKLQDMIFLMIITDFALVFTSYIVYLNIDTVSQEMMLALIFFNIIVVTIVFMLNIYRILRFSKQLTESRLKTQYMEMQLQQNENLNVLAENLRGLRHDMNNHVGVIYGLLNTKQYNRLNDYVNSLYKNLQEANDLIIVNNEILSIILNNKKHLAKEKNIQLLTWIEVKAFILTEIEVCSLVGNILDNAIEAAEKIADYMDNLDKEIRFVCVEKEEGWYIDCKNPYLEEPKVTQQGLMTSKLNKELHGIGSRTMKDIIQKYGGTLEYSTEDNIFTVKVFISKQISLKQNYAR